MTNPLLAMTGLPPFSQILPEHVEPAVESVISENRALIGAILKNQKFTWANLVQPLEEMDDRLARIWSPVSHMNAVVNNEELRKVYNSCLTKLTSYTTEIGQNEELYAAFKSIADGEEYEKLDVPQRKIVENTLRDFRLSGVELSSQGKARFKDIMQQLAFLTAKFEENLLDSTNGWRKQINNMGELAGLPEISIALARQAAEQRGLDGWVLTVEYPCYVSVMTHADDRELRREVYEAYVTRASEAGPNAGKWDNTDVMEKILALRHEAAHLLGYNNYAEYAIEPKMATSTDQVMAFLNDLARRSVAIARKEFAELQGFARNQFGIPELEAWDIPYYSEKLRQHKYKLSQEEVKPYFSSERVLAGMFNVVNRLYGLVIKERGDVDTWHPDVRFYEIFDDSGELRGKFYLDLYARPHKRGGAWMDDCISRKRIGAHIQTPVAFLTCNFSPPLGTVPALFTHEEVLVLFHEFGHGLHHMLTKVNYPSISGISGVPWDAVELPSQFMENWCWEREALEGIAIHYETAEPMPEEMFRRLLRARNFQAGMLLVRQLEFAIFDFRLHMEYDPASGPQIYQILQEVRSDVAVVKLPEFNRFAHGFSHIFTPDYAAGYYSYKWSEVLSSDAFAAFEENGIFDRETGLRFLSAILEQGGARDPMEMFIEFRGREPSIDPLLRHSGILAD